MRIDNATIPILPAWLGSQRSATLYVPVKRQGIVEASNKVCDVSEGNADSDAISRWNR
jgi:hypothetical protein